MNTRRIYHPINVFNRQHRTKGTHNFLLVFYILRKELLMLAHFLYLCIFYYLLMI